MSFRYEIECNLSPKKTSSRLNLRGMKESVRKSVNFRRGKSPVVKSNNLSSHIIRKRVQVSFFDFCVKWKNEEEWELEERWQSGMLINWGLWPTKQLSAKGKLEEEEELIMALMETFESNYEKIFKVSGR